jgi:AraC-like DNA-binding protein
MHGAEVYEATPPPETLRPFVAALWTYRADSPSGEVQRIVPDGCCELILHLGEPYEEQGPDGTWRLQPRMLFAGQLTRPLALRPTGPLRVVAARFEPDGARSWLGRPLSTATDRTLDVAGRIDRPPPEDLAALGGWLEALRAREGWRLDPLVRAAVSEPPETTGLHPRALQRLMLDRVGVPMQTLRAIRRFRAVFDRVDQQDPEVVTWLQAGLEAGYFDQPQMSRDFRRFLGCTATEWARQRTELARRLASQSYKTGMD